MNHRAAGGGGVEIEREEQGTRGARETRAAMGGTGWMGWRAGRQEGWKSGSVEA